MLGKDFVILWCCNTRSLLVRLQLNDKNLDVTADGWILERLSAQNLRFAGPIQSLGIKLGVLIGFPGFMLLESKFAWVTLPNYFLAMSVMLLISLIVIVFLVAETVSGKSKDIELKGFDELETKSMVDGQFELTPWTIFKCLLKGSKFLSSKVLILTLEIIHKRNIQMFVLVVFVICIPKSTVAHGVLFNLKIQDLGFERRHDFIFVSKI